MAIGYCQTTTLSRSKGYNMSRKAAYNARECLRDKDGHQFDYSRYQKDELVEAGIIAPPEADPKYLGRQTLWQEVERQERRKDSQLAREQIIALPHELSEEHQKEITQRYCAVLVERYGVVVDYAIHRPSPQSDRRNIHAHVLFTTRQIDKKTGQLGDKIEVLRNPAKSGEQLKLLRQKLQSIVNAYLPPEKQIDLRSYEARGSDRPAQIHLGKNRVGWERRTGQKDELRQNYEQRLRRWEENQATEKCLQLFPVAHHLKIEGIRKQAGQYQWNTEIFPAKNCRQLLPMLKAAIKQERQRQRQILKEQFTTLYKQVEKLEVKEPQIWTNNGKIWFRPNTYDLNENPTLIRSVQWADDLEKTKLAVARELLLNLEAVYQAEQKRKPQVQERKPQPQVQERKPQPQVQEHQRWEQQEKLALVKEYEKQLGKIENAFKETINNHPILKEYGYFCGFLATADLTQIAELREEICQFQEKLHIITEDSNQWEKELESSLQGKALQGEAAELKQQLLTQVTELRSAITEWETFADDCIGLAARQAHQLRQYQHQRERRRREIDWER